MTTASRPPRGTALWHPQAHMPSVAGDRLEFVSGDGAWVTVADGRRLLDATSGLWHANVGHGRGEIADAAAAQMRTLETYHLFGRFANGPALDLADRLAAMAPVPEARVFLTSGGADAVEAVCKLARRFWQVTGRPAKRAIASRDGAYHGLHGFGTSVSGLPSNREGYGVASLVPETLRVPTNDLEGARRALEEHGPENVAALITEPVQGTGGVVPPSAGYLTGLQALCREHDVLFVVDEVITGFGRTGTMFACERFGIEPDVLLIAKGVTSGYAPLGAMLVGPRVAEPFFRGPDAEVFRHGITYSGHATACAVAHANLDVLEREGLMGRVADLEPVLQDAVGRLAGHELVDEVRGAGLLAGVQLRADVDGEAVVRQALDEGVVLRTITGNTIQICPPFVATPDEVRSIPAAIERALARVAVAA